MISEHKWYQSLRWKLFLSYAFICFMPLIIFLIIIINFITNNYVLEREEKNLKEAKIIAKEITDNDYLFHADENKFSVFLEDVAKEQTARIIIIDKDAVVIKDTDTENSQVGKIILTKEIAKALEGEETASLQTNQKSTYGEDEIIYACANISSGGEIVAVVLAVTSATDLLSPIDTIKNQLIIFILVLGIIATALVFWFSKYLINPLRKILESVQDMSEGHLDQRINLKVNDEFLELGNAFNIMAEKLELVEKTREEFVSNVSHELKTPLSSIKVLSEAILLQEDIPIETYQEFLRDITSEVDRMTDIVNDLLHLVKLNQREIALSHEEVDINKVVADVLKRLIPLAEEKNIALFYEEIKRVVIDADEMKLSLAISNLVENAIKYTQTEGAVKVMIDADHKNVFVTVQDTGIGINEDDQQLVFNRFYRVDKTRDRETGGTGLGLSITHSTVLLHNGSIRLTSKENEGSTFVVRLPIYQKPVEEKE